MDAAAARSFDVDGARHRAAVIAFPDRHARWQPATTTTTTRTAPAAAAATPARWTVADARQTLGKPATTGTVRDWRPLAACAGINPDLFFPRRGESAAAAVATCRTCPVQAECLTDALNNGEKVGIWGGMSERQRRILRGRT